MQKIVSNRMFLLEANVLF